MKRLVLLFMPLILLVGCSQKTDVKAVTRGIEFNTRVCYYNECYEADAQFSQNGERIFNITSPESIAGLTLVFNGEDVTATYKGMEYKAENPQLFGAFSLVNRAILDVEKKDGVVRVDDNSYSVEGFTDGGEYELTVSTQGLPIELDVDKGDLEMNFLNVKLQ